MLTFCVGVIPAWFYNAAELNCKLNAKQNIQRATKLEQVTITTAEFAALRDKEEIKVNGTLYDVSSYEVKDGYVVVSVWHDGQEETLQNKLSSIFESQQQISNTGNQPHIVKYHPYFPDFKVMPEQPALLAFFTILNKPVYSEPGNATLAISLLAGIIKPPPDTLA
jgi:hypothetical protein